MTLSMKLLGSPRIDVDGAPMDVDTRKATALLAYLAVEGGAHPRDRLVDLLWPDSDVDRARSSLRRTLSTIRTALDGRWLRADRHVVTLDLGGDGADGVDIDVADVERLLARHDHRDRRPCAACRAELAPLPDLLGAPFLDGFAVRGAAPFERWMLDTSERLGQRLDRGADLLERALADNGDLPGAIAVTARRLARDPLCEEVARSQMHHQASAGDRAAAIATYRRLVAVLDDELGVPPLEQTTELYHSILEGALAPHPDPDPPKPHDGRLDPADFPLVGRDTTSAAVDRHVAEGRIALVLGEAGMGKTRFLTEFGGRARTRGDVVLTASGTPGRAEIPLGVLHQALAPALERVDLDLLPERVVAELSELFPALPATTVTAAGSKAALYDALARLLVALGTCAVVVDDLEWADEATLEALSFLVDHHTGPIRLVASATAERHVRDAASLGGLARRAEAVRLHPLDAVSIATLSEHAGRHVDPAQLLRETRGVPLLVVESLRSSGDVSVPDSVRRLFTSRIDALSGPAAQVLDALVALGAPAPPTVARSASGRSPDETDVALVELVDGGLVVETAEGIEVVYAHVSSLVEEAMTPPRLRLIHRRCADALTTVGADPIRIARHHLAAGDPLVAATWFERSGDAARNLLAHDDAATAYESALAAGHPDRAGIRAKLGRTAMHGGDYRRAIEHYEAALATGADDRAAFELGALFRRLRRWDVAAAHLSGIDLDGVPADLAAQTCAELAVVEAQRGNAADARRLADEAVERARTSGDANVIATAANAAAILDRPPGREPHLLAASEQATEPHVRIAVLNNLAATIDDVDKAVAAAREAVELADTVGDRHVAAAAHNTLADALRRAGRDDAARAEVTRSVELFAGVTTGIDDLDPHIWMLAEL